MVLVQECESLCCAQTVEALLELIPPHNVHKGCNEESKIWVPAELPVNLSISQT